MNTVTQIAPHLNTIKAPAFLADLPIWLMWKFENSQGEAKPRKVPYYASGERRSGPQGRAEDRSQLVTLEVARAAAAKRGMSGIGHACMDSDFTVIDFDRCVTDGKLNPVVEALTMGTYAEYSPSGTGIHLYVKGDLRGTNEKSPATADQFGIELFATKGYVTFTGAATELTDMLGNTDTIGDASTELQELIAKRFGSASDIDIAAQEPKGVSRELILEALSVLDPDMGHADWLKVGMAIHHETRGEGFDLWDQWSQGGGKYPGDLSGRWETFGRNAGPAITINSLVQMANFHGATINLNAVSLEGFDDLDAILEASVSTTSESKDIVADKLRFNIETLSQFAIITSHKYLIKAVLPRATLGVLFGESGSGKSFITLDMCIAIALGQPWRGKRTMQGRVVYIVAEGAAGFRNRVIAHLKHYGIDPATVPLDILNDTPSLLLKEDAQALIKAIHATGEPPALVVVDTLAQSMAGANENASEDMGKALAHCKGIHKSTGAMVLLVHHSGKDSSKGARGWSGMRASADVELEVTRSAQGRALRTTKQKDGADFEAWGFDLNVVNIGEDADGDQITSCVVVEAAVPSKDKKTTTLGPIEQIILNVMSDIAMEQISGIERSAVVDLVMLSFPEITESGQIKAKRERIRRSLKKFYEGDDAIYALETDDTLTILDSE
jgi:hypothetical protein